MIRKLKTISVKLHSLCSSLFILIFIGACNHKQTADLIIHHAQVYTVDSSFSNAESFAIKDGKFLAVGSNEEILSGYEAKETIDAGGKAVYPGLIDSHCHFYGYGEGLQQVDLVGTKSFDEVIERVKTFAKEHPTTEWIIGRGWDQNDWEVKEFPMSTQLDALFPDRPVVLKRVDGHAVLANQEALKRANINASTKVEGGKVEYAVWPYNNSRMATGILIDNAVDLLERIIPKPSKEEIKNSLLAAQKDCFAVGLTTVDDAGLEKNIVDAIDEFQKSGELKMRIYAMLTDNKENAETYLRSKKNQTYNSGRLHVRSFKFYADGALGSRGACLLQPYSDKPGQRGFLLSAPEHFDSMSTLMMTRGFQMNTHCIGDSAIRLILNIEKKYAHGNAAPQRWRIEHFQVTTRQDIDYLSTLPKGTVIPSVQPTHATSDMYWAKDRLGAERMKYAYAYNDLLKASGIIALGTDFPVENINPMYTFYAAVARKDLKGFPKDGFQMENALSRENTLRGMTIWGAFANFEENEKGSIEKGKFADFVILDKDIMKCEIDSVPKAKVISTFVNGEQVWHN